MDDGFQNPSLIKDLSLLVVDGGYGFGNGRVMPAGPLREAIEGWHRARRCCDSDREDRYNVAARLGRSCRSYGQRWSRLTTPDAGPGKRVLAFAGIGRPGKFFDSLRDAGAILIETREFPDHHAYGDGELEILLERAGTQNAIAVTTSKDWVRLPVAARAAGPRCSAWD